MSYVSKSNKKSLTEDQVAEILFEASLINCENKVRTGEKDFLEIIAPLLKDTTVQTRYPGIHAMLESINSSKDIEVAATSLYNFKEMIRDSLQAFSIELHSSDINLLKKVKNKNNEYLANLKSALTAYKNSYWLKVKAIFSPLAKAKIAAVEAFLANNKNFSSTIDAAVDTLFELNKKAVADNLTAYRTSKYQKELGDRKDIYRQDDGKLGSLAKKFRLRAKPGNNE